MRVWKVLGVAGVAGVAASGVIIAREQRQRAQLDPEQVRARLHQRLEQAGQPDGTAPAATAPAAAAPRRPRTGAALHRLRRLRPPPR